MYKMQTIVTIVRSVSLSVCLSIRLSVCHALNLATYPGSFAAAFAKLLWPQIFYTDWKVSTLSSLRRIFGRLKLEYYLFAVNKFSAVVS